MMSQRFTTRSAQLLRAQRFAAHRPYSSGPSPFQGAADNAFNRERWAVKQHAAQTTELWRKLSIYVALPLIALGVANAWVRWKAHWAHWDTLPPLEERTEYAYQNIRTKNFFWGNGDKTLFWNDKVNYHKKDE
ncbi:mitochondrial cytochrome c oxidase subunit VIa [Pseudovirgaria hyperparasitica]|uniref:Cytochrome c oxidase subunit 13, mitochondrial n=1 Tax=Pseudovirgaria hyperparasitica TaxID=470096 RepID=A0A6A6W410_9PEZI|nr:mitochondrial cytochrome c oxidase subunit VIa [Pseudovirgaria hyperparasitica]KAF2757295.1 mitochondrial cytochrome c oxidase subunit VIa [Pseudovirgaria hyperparasitica]